MDYAHPQPSPSAISERVLREQVAGVYATIGTASLADSVLAISVSVGYAWLTQSWWPLVWLMLHTAQALRYPVLGAYAKSTRDQQPPQFWARRYVREVTLNSSVWGLAPWFMLGTVSVTLTVVLVLVVLALCTTGMSSVMPLRQAIWAYCCPMVIGLATALLWRSDLFGLTAAACAIAYLAATLHFAANQHRLFTQALVARFENAALVEQLAQQVQLTEQISAEKTRFLAAASHDLRQPVHAISLFGAVIEKELQGHPQQVNAQRLLRAVQALGSSLDAMLDISRLDAGDVAPTLAPTPLQPILQNLNQTFGARADELGLQLRVRATAWWAYTDAALLQRLLGNLVDNALKYTPHGGVLVLVRARGAQLWIEVRDTGIGIAPEHWPRLFNEFYQVDNPGRDRSRGLGMGLSIVQRLARLLAHPIVLRSWPGHGSLFRVVVPRAAAQHQASRIELPPVDASMPLPMRPLRVLLVDDEDDIALAMDALMRSLGHQLVRVADPAQAHAACAAAEAEGTPFDAVICDLRLVDGADGLALALALRESQQPPLPIVLITGETAPEPLRAARDSGLPLLFKPVAATALLQALAQVST